jgi:transcriptional regulator with XRE-family HTH domain
MQERESIPKRLIARRLRRARIKKKLSPGALADLTYVSRRTVERRENAERNTSLEDLWLYAQIFVALPEGVLRRFSAYEASRQRFLIFCAQITLPDGLMIQEIKKATKGN